MMPAPIVTSVVEDLNAEPEEPGTQSKWANRKLLPEYEAMLKTGAFSGGTDSSISLSEERDESDSDS